MTDDAAAFVAAAERWDATGDFDPETREALAARAARAMRAARPDLFAFAEFLPVGPAGLPLVPVRRFKEERLAYFPEGEAAAVFATSGTTGRPGRRFVRDLASYRAAARAAFRRFVGAFEVLALLPPVEEAPDWSLAWMMRFLGARTFAHFAADGDRYRLATDEDILRAAVASSHRPVAIFGTAIALAELAARPLPLPPGSVVVETGGTKGRTVSWDPAALRERLVEAFGAPVVSEYGMTEAYSQGYDTDGRGFRFPPWVAVGLVDPETRALSDEGLVALWDLAVTDGPPGILTEDIGRREEDRIVLLGRASDAELRGCSLRAG